MLAGHGEVALVAGQATVAMPRITADATVILSRRQALGTVGNLTWSVSAGDSFTISSMNILDTSVVRWAVFS